MKTSFLIVFICILSACNQEDHKTETFRNPVDFESAEVYFELMEQLEMSDSISHEDWEYFVSLKGNKLYIQENNIPESIVTKIRSEMNLCYIPANDKILDSTLSKDIRLQIRNRYQSFKTEYRAHMQWLKKNTSVLQDSALQLAKQYLPNRMHQLDSFPPIYFHALWDGSANSEGIFVDIILQYDFDQKRLGSFIAHELHHIMLQSALNLDQVNEKDKGLLWAILSSSTEGLADMVDKSSLVYEGSNWWLNEQYMALLNYADESILQLNDYIEKAATGKSFSEAEYREVLFNSVGHIPGQFMAETIQDHGKLNLIIEEAQNPFVFFYVYNEIAVAYEDIPQFSETSIQYLKQLEHIYIK